ncbi:hypothetical protein EV361DRAFT_926799 [Lentinula raphanica]|uniref:Uncharacterized protein n=1 Tax=Lentinula raphanica TaxID=153919 RepID=A0AA38PC09_9AGAR|nr:hypothetical protein EV360DRAFT_80523 [Lentinula raphanica]KAJ3822876.1 hypothetical protein F5880DRAFT_615027 [Lentinula raphanica]KAJ3840125.1 hypothetical protein F5878DRAFT_659686 [Lentinula raphanica]KAJ3968265.1 hypothetical protein EV361DRAFT_926799 [Lentinula raphanica]
MSSAQAYPQVAYLSCWPQSSSSHIPWSWQWPYPSYPPYVPNLVFPPSPSDNSSATSSEPSLTPPPQPQSLHVICNAPLIAPKPLPYHSPTFLKFELLPDLDEDLSHPPYTQRPSKRKREDCDQSADFVVRKRHAICSSSATLPPRPTSVSSRRHKPVSVRHHVHPYRSQK